MANFVINQTASEIQQILNKAESPDATPTPNSQNLVQSGGVKTYVDTQVSAGASITTASFAPSALEDSTDGLTATDDAIPTSAAVQDYIEDTVPTLTEVIDVKTNTATVPTSGIIQLPSGYKATSAKAFGYRITVTLQVKNIGGGTTTTLDSGNTAAKVGQAMGQINLTFSEVSSTATNYLFYSVVNYNGFSDEFHGIRVNVEPI